MDMIDIDQISDQRFTGTLYDVYLEGILRNRKDAAINNTLGNCIVQPEPEQGGSQSSVSKEYMNFVRNDERAPTASQTNPAWESLPNYGFARSTSSFPQANHFPVSRRVINGVPYMVSNRAVHTGIHACDANKMFPSRAIMQPGRMVRRGPTLPGSLQSFSAYRPPLFVQSQAQLCPLFTSDERKGYNGQLHPPQQFNCVHDFGSENRQHHSSSATVKFYDTRNIPFSHYTVIGEPVLAKLKRNQQVSSDENVDQPSLKRLKMENLCNSGYLNQNLVDRTGVDTSPVSGDSGVSDKLGKLKRNQLFPSDEIIDQPNSKRLKMDNLCNWVGSKDQNLAERTEIDTSPVSGVIDNSPGFELNDASALPQGLTDVHKQNEIQQQPNIIIAEEEPTADDHIVVELCPKPVSADKNEGMKSNDAERTEIDTSPVSGVTDNSPGFELNDASALLEGLTAVHKQNEIQQPNITIAVEEHTADDHLVVELSPKLVETKEPESTANNNKGMKSNDAKTLAERTEIDTSPMSGVTDNYPGFELNDASALPQGLTDVHKQNEIQQPNIIIAEEEPTADDHIVAELSPKQVEAKEPESIADNSEGMKSNDTKNHDVSMSAFFTESQIREHLHSLSEEFCQQSSSGSENICLLCAKENLLFAPTPIYCSPCSGRIKYKLIYYSVKNDEHGTTHFCCSSCFKGAHDTSIIIQGVRIPKTKFKKEKYHERIDESWVACKKCQRWLHQICGLYNAKIDFDGNGEYVCPKCCLQDIESGARLPLPDSSVVGAKNLPRTMLSDHLEQRLFTNLQQERQNTAKSLGKKIEEVPEAGDLVVRVVLNADNNLAVKKEYSEIFQRQNYPEAFPYKSKAILLFQNIDGVDVCIFIMYVQEFGSECSDPNKRCIYISYLDSINYFRPRRQTSTGEALRTFVYHELLIGYLDYCKKRGFVTCYLWACPPSKGDDYILNCHPESQKAPKSDKLRAWYKRMLKKAAIEEVVVNCTNLYEEFFVPRMECSAKINVPCLPYFDGDFWSNAAMEIVSKENIKTGGSQKLKIKKKSTPKRTVKAMALRIPNDEATTDMLIMQKLGQTILSTKDDFIVVQFQLTCTCCHEVIISDCHYSCNHCKNFHLCSRCAAHNKNTHTSDCGKKHQLTQVAMKDVVRADTEDNDKSLESEVFDTRLHFLGFCQQNNYQFDTLRRAKHSSMMIVYQLSKSTAPEPPPPPEELDLRSLVNHAGSCKCRINTCKYDPKCSQLKLLFTHFKHCKDRSTQQCEYCLRVRRLIKHCSNNL